MASIVNLENAIINFVNQHPEGVSFDELKIGVRERNQHYDLGRCAESLVFHYAIEKRNDKGEIYNPNHYQNDGIFKYYPRSDKPRKPFNKYYPFSTLEELQKYKVLKQESSEANAIGLKSDSVGFICKNYEDKAK